MPFNFLAENLARVRDEIQRIQAREGLDHEVTIVAVTKGHPPAAARAALTAGLADVGENRVQEALAKQEELAGLPVRWHLIGHLQTNKARYVAGRFAMVHSLDSLKVVEALDRQLARRRTPEVGGEVAPLAVLVQVNVAGEAQKYGCAPEGAELIARRVAASPFLALRGLMTMAPLIDSYAEQRRVFAALRRLRDDLAATGLSVPELSMGMSGDYPAAVAEGATIVRLGTVLFGERPA